MNCNQVQDAIDDLLDLQLDPVAAADAQAHIETCDDCRRAYERTRALIGALRTMPAPLPAPDFAARAIAEARRSEQRTVGRGFWLGGGGALAAGLALWLAFGLVGPSQTAGTLPQVQIALGTPQNVDLAVNAEYAMERVRFTVSLPQGVELVGMPGNRELSWEGRLRAGANLLSLPMLARGHVDGTLEAKVQFGDKAKTYRVHIAAAGANERSI